MPQPLFVASSNPGKLRDFAAAAEVFGVEIRPLPALDGIVAPPEDGTTFAENARDKALYYSRFQPHAVVLADDSGLEVDALGGAPGVHSARYAVNAGIANPHQLSADAMNNRHLLTELEFVPEGQRTARYCCVLAAARDGILLATATGFVEGTILTQPRGRGGFGYDPLFLLPDRNLTMAEIDLATKQQLSHRGRALQAMLRLRPDFADREAHPLRCHDI